MAEANSDLKEIEVRVLKLTARGYSNKEIARFLNYNVKTIEGHRGRINKKLRFDKRSQLVAYANEQGWLFE